MHEAEQRAEFELLMESQFWPADRIRTLQRERLEKLLRHAKAHVPFYATRLDPLFRGDGSIDWDRWEDIPTLTRDDLLTHRRALLARTMPEGPGNIGDISTSGSTGKPVTTSHSSLSLALSSAAVFRANTNDKVDFSARIGFWRGLRADVAAWPDGSRSKGWGPWWDPRTAAGETFTINHLVPPAQVLEFMARNDVRYVMCGGADARLLAHEAERLGADISLDAILTRGTDATAAGRQLIQEVFGARTLSLYSSKEAHRIAHLNLQCGTWHINEEQVALEILDDANRPVGARLTGRVVVTPLNGYAQPLIRYEQGDLAKLSTLSCACGRGLRALEEIVGRVRHLFVLADGSRIVPDLPVTAVAALNAAMFQIAQVSRNRIEIRYVPRLGKASDATPLIDNLRSLMGSVSIEPREVQAFDVPAGRKHIEYVCELDDLN